MFIKHKLKKGEDFKSVMRKFGIKDWDGIWNLKGNTALRKKRKYADKVEAGDVLVLFDGKAKYHRVALGSKTYLVSTSEWSTMTKKVIAEMNTKYLVPIGKIKKIYDDDFNFLQDLANDNSIAGFFAALVENRSGAKLPTKEMGAASAAILTLQKKILAGKFGEIEGAAKKAQDAMNKYAAASELYRRKMTDGATRGVKIVKFVDDYAIVVAAAIATGGASTVVGGAFTAVEIAAAMGAGGALLKASSKEFGKKVAGEDRTAQEIGINIMAKMMAGGLEGMLGAKLLGGKYSSGAVGGLAGAVSKRMPKVVDKLVRVEGQSLIGSPSLLKGLGTEKAAQEVSKLMARTTMGTVKVYCKKLIDEDDDIVSGAIKIVLKKLTGTEDEKKMSAMVGEAIATEKNVVEVTRRIIKGQRKVIVKHLETIEVTEA